MLARLHAVPPPAVPVTPRSLYPRVVTLVVRRLVRQGRLPARAGTALLALTCPAAPRTGLTHGDACPENLVRTPSGRLRAIDEERVAVRPVAYDIARAICRWPLDAGEERAWLSGYAAGGGNTGEFLRDRAFWIAAALATSAAYRMRYRPTALGPIVRELRALASSPS
jgi:aminoglycoside phosphotransferase (APT) family kinase protein